MKPIRSLLILVAMLLIVSTSWAQPGDFARFPGDEERPHRSAREDRLASTVEFLDLSESQAAEWQAIVERHRQSVGAARERIGTLREEFRELADREDPDLQQLGKLSLEMHRTMESMRAEKDDLRTELETLLTPEQRERFEALRAARDISGPRGRHRHRSRSDTEGVD